MGLLDVLDWGLFIGETATELSAVKKVNSNEFQENNQFGIYLYHKETHLSLLYAEQCFAGGYCCFGVWCRMNGYWKAAYQYLKIAAHDGTLRSRAEFARVCFVLGKYEEAIAYGNRYKYMQNWQPSLYMALSYYMLGDTEKCKESLITITQSPNKYRSEPAYARGFLQSEYGMKFEINTDFDISSFFNKISYGDTPDAIIPMDKNTAFDIASATENTAIYQRDGYKPFDLGGTVYFDIEMPKDRYRKPNEYTNRFLIQTDKWIKQLPERFKIRREEARQALEQILVTISDIEREEVIEDCRYLYNFEYDTKTGKLLDASTRLVPHPFDLEKIQALINLG